MPPKLKSKNKEYPALCPNFWNHIHPKSDAFRCYPCQNWYCLEKKKEIFSPFLWIQSMARNCPTIWANLNHLWNSLHVWVKGWPAMAIPVGQSSLWRCRIVQVSRTQVSGPGRPQVRRLRVRLACHSSPQSVSSEPGHDRATSNSSVITHQCRT